MGISVVYKVIAINQSIHIQNMSEFNKFHGDTSHSCHDISPKIYES